MDQQISSIDLQIQLDATENKVRHALEKGLTKYKVFHTHKDMLREVLHRAVVTEGLSLESMVFNSRENLYTLIMVKHGSIQIP